MLSTDNVCLRLYSCKDSNRNCANIQKIKAELEPHTISFFAPPFLDLAAALLSGLLFDYNTTKSKLQPLFCNFLKKILAPGHLLGIDPVLALFWAFSGNKKSQTNFQFQNTSLILS